MRIEHLRCEHLDNPLGLSQRRPRLSWQVVGERPGAAQCAYQVVAASSPERLSDPDLWDSGPIDSAECTLIRYEGAELVSRQRVWWTVTIWDERGDQLTAGATCFEMGLLERSDWSARWIAPEHPRRPERAGEVAYLRTRLHVEDDVRAARAYLTALGICELRVNGIHAGRELLTPGWTDYERRLHYQVIDIAELLVAGSNEICVVLADGWYAGWLGFVGGREYHGHTPQALAQLEVETGSGRVTVSTDETWESALGPVLSSDFLMGESQDLRQQVEHRGAPVELGEGTSALLLTSPGPPVRVTAELLPVSIERVDAETHRIDFGQNFVGRVRLRLDGLRGQQVTVRHAEVLAADGSLYVDNLRSARSIDSYVLSGRGPERCEPVFAFHGLRYAEVSGYPGTLGSSDVHGIVIGSDVELTGQFECSHAGLNQLHSNIVWGARGNFLEVPTDCPQRDERLGWTGDAQVFAPTAGYLLDDAAFFTKWLRDLADAQSEEGGFPDVAPRVVDPYDGAAGWADAGVLVPWTVCRHHGDRELLSELYPAMRRWVDYVHVENPSLLWLHRRNQDVGDWLHLGAATDKDLIATAFFAQSTRTTARAADLLGHAADARELHSLADGITTAFRETFVLPDGRLTSGTQTAYALALRFGLVPDDAVAAATDALVEAVEEAGGLTTGFLGVAHLLPVLSAGGRVDVAYDLLLSEDFPAWLYSVRHGATTIWERWDGWTEERGFQDPAMNSFNHYAFGAVGEWMYRTVAGIDWVGAGCSDSGRHELIFAPMPSPRLDWVRATARTPVGVASTSWRWLDDFSRLALRLEVPVGCDARLRIGAEPDLPLASGIHELVLDRDRLDSVCLVGGSS